MRLWWWKILNHLFFHAGINRINCVLIPHLLRSGKFLMLTTRKLTKSYGCYWPQLRLLKSFLSQPRILTLDFVTWKPIPIYETIKIALYIHFIPITCRKIICLLKSLLRISELQVRHDTSCKMVWAFATIYQNSGINDSVESSGWESLKKRFTIDM